MATVVDVGGNSVIGSATDNKLCKPNRTNAGTPSGSLTPRYAGELVYDTTNAATYRGVNTSANTSWEKVFPDNP